MVQPIHREGPSSDLSQLPQLRQDQRLLARSPVVDPSPASAVHHLGATVGQVVLHGVDPKLEPHDLRRLQLVADNPGLAVSGERQSLSEHAERYSRVLTDTRQRLPAPSEHEEQAVVGRPHGGRYGDGVGPRHA